MEDKSCLAQNIRSLLKHARLQGTGIQDVRDFLGKDFTVLKIKQNPVRQIFKLESTDGNDCFYFKYFHHLPLHKRIFHFSPKIEYKTAEFINGLGIPVIPYAVWGRTVFGGMTFSYAVNSMQAREYIFKTAYHSKELQKDFFEKLAMLCQRMLKQHILHPDFHMGNILVKDNDSNLILADPPGMRCVHNISENYRIALLVPWREMYGIFPDATIAHYVVQSGLCATEQESIEFLTYAMEMFQGLRRSRYEHIRRQVLEGNSKYTREFKSDGKLYSFHHNLFFDFPKYITIDPDWERKDFKGVATSERLWIESMLYQDCRQKQPVLRVLYPDGNSSLYYTDFRTYLT